MSPFDRRDRADVRQHRVRLVGGKWEYEQTKGMNGKPDRIRLMARSGGYVMVRKPRCVPFVLSEKEWAKLPLYESLATLPDPATENCGVPDGVADRGDA